jgi:hypothetical protein
LKRTSLAVALSAVAIVQLVLFAGAAEGKGRLKVSTLSSAPDLVSGGDALVAVDVPAKTKAKKVQVRLNGVPVKPALRPGQDNPRRLVGVVSGMRNGTNVISARASGDQHPASLAVFNSPITGPLFSGPHQSPFICTTEAGGLGPATDADCSAPTQVEYRYRSTDGTFKPLADPAVRPPDLAQTTTRDGRTVDYVVRIESGVINRSLYHWSVLAPGGQPDAGWNGRLIYSFGGGCGAGYQQGSNGIGTVLDDRQLSEGYSVASSSLTVLGTACNDVLSAETVEMTKEHIIESLGRKPAWTIGEGSSGGSVQAQLIGQNYPGLLDGLLPSQSFPDNSSPDYPDCRLLNAYFGTAAGSGLSNAQRKAVTGLEDPNGCAALSQGADVVNATEGCDESVVPASLIFDPVTNPGGARCTLWDSMVNVYGRDPATGYARRTLDNTGVQYGLKALQDSSITPGEFLDLNEGVGGFDDNGFIRPQRSVANLDALEIAYGTGRFNQGAGGIPSLPIIDARTYVDDEANVHQYVNAYRMRARLQRFNGTYANQVMFRAKGGQNTGPMNDTALDLMGTWLDNIAADGSDRTAPEKVIADKPGAAIDACWIGGQRVNGAAVIGDPNQCETTYPPHSLPVNQAGKPLESIADRCQLKPIDLSDYPSLSAGQESRLRALFPDGVCDWSKEGVNETRVDGTWKQFGPDRQIKAGKLKLKLGSKRKSGKGSGKAVLTATLRPCPEATWQRVSFEHKAGRKWRSFHTDIASGKRCRAKATMAANGKRVPVRATVKATPGFHGVKSKRIRVGG